MSAKAETERAFREFVDARWGALVRFGTLLTGDRASGEDLVQAALEKCWPKWSSIDAPEAYVKAAMANHLVSASRRRRWREVPLEERVDVGHVERALDTVGERDALWSLLLTLPSRMRSVVVLRYVEDLSEADTAKALGVSVGTIKSQASEGLKRMRIALTHVEEQGSRR